MNIPDNVLKEKIEEFLRAGFAPVGCLRGVDGRGSAIHAAQEWFNNAGQGMRGHSWLHAWVRQQIRAKELGHGNFCPDWNLYPPRAALIGNLGTQPVLPGFEIVKTTTVQGDQGETIREFIQQKPAPVENFELPPEHEIAGVSALVDKDGRIVNKWVKTRAGYQDRQLALESIKEVFSEYQGRSELPPAPATVDLDRLTSYVIGDHHFGMFSWRNETGFDYDMKIAEDLLHTAMTDLVQSVPQTETALIVSLGDFFHTDTSFNVTPKSGHHVDIDTRRAKVYKAGVMLLIMCIEFALTKHKFVKIRCLPGNHDPDTTPTLAIALWAFFHNNPRIEVDLSASRFFFYEFGRTMIAGTHGDMAKIQDMPNIMAAREPEMWGRTRFRYAYAGHVHHKERICREIGSVVCETFQVLPPVDAWHAAMGFTPGRSMTAITYDRRLGERIRHTSSVPFPETAIEEPPEKQ